MVVMRSNKKKGKRKIHTQANTAPESRMFGVPGRGVSFSLNVLIGLFSALKPISETYTLRQAPDGELLVHTGLYARKPDIIIGPAKEPLALPPGCVQPCAGDCETCPNPAY